VKIKFLSFFIAFLFLITLYGCIETRMGNVNVSSLAMGGVKLAKAMVPMSDQDEIMLGRETAAKVIGKFGIYKNEVLTHYINTLGSSIAKYSDRPNIPYHFAILNTVSVNAFAAPGRYIFITYGTLKKVKDEAELAAILAHEIGHVTQRHIVKEIQKSNLLGAVGSFAEAFAKDRFMLSKLSDFSTNLLIKGLSREDELESDRLGVIYTERLGYTPWGLYRFLNTLQNIKGDDSRKMTYYNKTHPPTGDRATLIYQFITANNYPTSNYKIVRERFEKVMKSAGAL